MKEDFSIINTNSRNEKIKDFFVNNKKKVYFVIIFLFLIGIGVFSYDKYRIDKKKEISDNFNSIIIEFNKASKEKSKDRLIEIVKKKDPTYSSLALYFIIDNNLINEQEVIISLFDILIKETSLDYEIKNLVIYKKALYLADKSDENNLLGILNPLINSESTWRSHALYLMGEYFYINNQMKKAKEFFTKILESENSNPDLRLLAEKRLNRDLSE
tara:strand:+ start:1382 stop:2026 length:645 start_codon:yes stop_codon:yes gene_type:complete